AQGPEQHAIRDTNGPTSSVQSVPSAQSALLLSCHTPTEPRSTPICARLPIVLMPAPMPSSFWTAPDGTPLKHCKFHRTLPFSPCRPTLPSSTRSKTSGNTCAATSSPIVSSTITRQSSPHAAKPGTISWRCPKPSPPSRDENGQTCHDIRQLVLRVLYHSGSDFRISGFCGALPIRVSA